MSNDKNSIDYESEFKRANSRLISCTSDNIKFITELERVKALNKELLEALHKIYATSPNMNITIMANQAIQKAKQ